MTSTPRPPAPDEARAALAEAHRQMTPDAIAAGALNLAVEVAQVQAGCIRLIDLVNKAGETSEKVFRLAIQQHELVQHAAALIKQHRKSEARELIFKMAAIPPLEFEPVPRLVADFGTMLVAVEAEPQ